MAERVAVFIDGSNLYYKLKSPEMDFKNLRNFNYRGLCEFLARGRTVVACGYYVGAVRAGLEDARAQEMRKKQQQLFGHLESPSQQFIIKRGI